MTRCSCLCSCAKKDRICVLTILGALQVIVAISSIGIGNWAVFSYPVHLRKTAAFNFWSGGVILFSGVLSIRAWRHVNKLWITTAAVTAFLATLMYMSSGCWMIKLLIEETDVDKSAKVYVFYGFNMTSSILGFLFAGLAAAVGWSVREQLCTRRTNCTNTTANRVGPTTVTSFSNEDFRRSMADIHGPPPPYEP